MLAYTNALKVVVATLWLCGILIAVGCGRKPDVVTPPSSEAKAKPSLASKVYSLTGVVRSVESESGNVTIRHEDIPGLMPAMTMPFSVANKALLEDVQVGDEVEGKLTIAKGSSLLTELTVTRPAPAATLTLSTNGGIAKLESRPKLLQVGEVVPDFTMTTQEDKSIKLSDLRGEVVVLTFIYTRCPLPEFCPLLDKKFREIAAIEERSAERAKHVRLLSISFDPEHDTPAVLTEHAKIQGARPPLWTFAVATHNELSKVAAPLGLMYGPTPNEIIHNRVVAVIAPDGTLAKLITGGEGGTWSAVNVSKIIHGLISTKPK